MLNRFNTWEDFYRKNRDNEMFKEMIYKDQMKMEGEFKKSYEAKLTSEGKGKREQDKNRKRSTIQVNII